MVKVIVEFETDNKEDFLIYLEESFYGTGDSWRLIKLNSHIKPKTNKTKYPHLQNYLLGKDSQSD